MNVVSVTGNLTMDPEMGENDSGQEVCRMRLGIGPGPHGEPVYTDVKVFGAEARRCAYELARGQAVAISGWLDIAEWVDREGVERSRLFIGTTNVDFFEAGDEEVALEIHDESATGIVDSQAQEEDFEMLLEIPDLEEMQVEAAAEAKADAAAKANLRLPS